MQNVQITYNAGYLVASEAQTIPTGTTPPAQQVNVSQPYGLWIADGGVTFTDTTPSTPAVLVAGAPAAGQYSFQQAGQSGQSSPGVYQFSAADQGRPVAISYSFCPSSIEQVVLDLINERMAQRMRPGVKSRGLAGQETVTFDTASMPEWARRSLMPYMHVALV
jgi:hypothetical protein